MFLLLRDSALLPMIQDMPAKLAWIRPKIPFYLYPLSLIITSTARTRIYKELLYICLYCVRDSSRANLISVDSAEVTFSLL